MNAMNIETLSVHAGREDFCALGLHTAPLDLSTTYPIPELESAREDLDALAAGSPSYQTSPIYARLHNPTVARFERALALMEQAEQSVAFASGMGAITAVLLATTQHRRHVVAVRPLYGGTDHLLTSNLLNLQVTWATPGGIRDALRPDTAVVVVETPGNPTCALVDIAEVVKAAGEVPVLVDSTFATPVLQRPLALGATFSLHSATKFIGGHGDVLAGVVATNAAWGAELRKVRIATGGVLHPLGGYLLHRGLQTLTLRVRAAQATALVLAQRIALHPAVESVRYPGLPGGDPLHLIGRQMDGAGTMLAFEVAGGFDAAAHVLRSLRLITPALSLGSADTLIQHPAGLTHRVLSEAAREESGITEGLLRLSVGLEHIQDLRADLERALDGVILQSAGATSSERNATF